MVRTPGELAVLLRDKPEVKDEILVLFHSGTLENWLHSAGWEEPAQRVAKLKREGGSQVAVLVQLNQILVQGSARYGHDQQTREITRVLPEKTLDHPARPVSQLLSRQQAAVRSFWRLEEDRKRKEQEISREFQSREQQIKSQAAAEQDRVRKELKEARRAWEQASGATK